MRSGANRLAAAALAAAAVVAVPPGGAAGTLGDPAESVFGGQSAVAVFAHADGRVTATAAQAVAPGTVRVVLRTCDGSGCVHESGLRPGTVEPLSATRWRYRFRSSTVGLVDLTGRVSTARMTSQGCQIRWHALEVEVASEGADLATATWAGTAGGRPVRTLAGLRCTVAHRASVTTVRFHDRG